MSSSLNDPKKRKYTIGALQSSDSFSFDTPVDGTIEHKTGPSYKVPGLLVTDHTFEFPLDHSRKVPGRIQVFAREVVAPCNTSRNLPFLIYLQGGPGFESPRPTDASAWLKSAVTHFRVILMDQRGTGRSTPITTTNLSKRGSPEDQAEYLIHFRADSIVRDAEMMRKVLVPLHNCNGKWSVLGQSFGGFCCFTYLSLAPEGLTEVLITGGIPPGITCACSADETYRLLYRRVLAQNSKYYSRFPSDVEVVRRIVAYLLAQPGGALTTPSGTRITPRALQTLGMSGLGTGGGFERLHYLLESFFDGEGEVTPAFLKAFEGTLHWDSNPLYALLHEPIYCQGSDAAPRWSAQRVRDTDAEVAAAFDAEAALKEGRPILLTGEMVFPWMFEDFAALRPLAPAAHVLAQRSDWSELYRPAVLRNNTVPVAAAVYLEDMYVEYELAQKSAAELSCLRQWATNEYRHSAIRDDGARVAERLLSLVRDAILLD